MSNTDRRIWIVLGLLLVGGLGLLYFLERRDESPADRLRYREEAAREQGPHADVLPDGGTGGVRQLYVPAYSHAYFGRGDPVLLAITLSIRNVDPRASVVLRAVDYYDTAGARVRRFLERPRRVAPLETAEFFVEQSHEAGGSGANFVVAWEAAPEAQPLLGEAIMLGNVGQMAYSFVSRGVEMRQVP